MGALDKQADVRNLDIDHLLSKQPHEIVNFCQALLKQCNEKENWMSVAELFPRVLCSANCQMPVLFRTQLLELYFASCAQLESRSLEKTESVDF